MARSGSTSGLDKTTCTSPIFGPGLPPGRLISPICSSTGLRHIVDTLDQVPGFNFGGIFTQELLVGHFSFWARFFSVSSSSVLRLQSALFASRATGSHRGLFYQAPGVKIGGFFTQWLVVGALPGWATTTWTVGSSPRIASRAIYRLFSRPLDNITSSTPSPVVLLSFR